MKMAPVLSLAQLKSFIYRGSTNHSLLAVAASKNLGGNPETVDEALKFLQTEIQETGDEEGVVENINACIDLLE